MRFNDLVPVFYLVNVNQSQRIFNDLVKLFQIFYKTSNCYLFFNPFIYDSIYLND